MAVGDVAVQRLRTLLSRESGDEYGGVLGSSGFLGSEALQESLAGPSASAQPLQGRHEQRGFQSCEMSALLHRDDSSTQNS